MQVGVSIRKQFLQHLASGQALNGAQLARTLGCSRAAISRQAAELKKAGLSIQAKPGSGYQLQWPLSLLDEQMIRERLADHVPVHVFEQLPSTNQLLMKADAIVDGEACLAELQTAGRGRLGREWWSTPYRNLLLSLAWNWQQGPAALTGFSLAAGVAVIEALGPWQLPALALKWPNDILCQQRKLGGLLVEIRGEAEGPCRVVLGLGLNVHHPDPPDFLSDRMIDMHAAGAGQLDRNRLAARLITALRRMMQDFQRHGFIDFQERWNAVHAHQGQQVTVSGGRQVICGKALAVDVRGALLVEDEKGCVQGCVGGELSLRHAAQPAVGGPHELVG